MPWALFVSAGTEQPLPLSGPVTEHGQSVHLHQGRGEWPETRASWSWQKWTQRQLPAAPAPGAGRPSVSASGLSAMQTEGSLPRPRCHREQHPRGSSRVGPVPVGTS